MKLSTRSKYGLKACFELALHYEKGIYSLNTLAKKIDVSKTYLEQLFRLLIKDGILFSERGVNGGYALTKKPGDTTIGMIIRVLENEILLADCIHGCCEQKSCPTKNIWTRLDNAINGVLDSITLQDMVDDFLKENNNG